MAVADYAEGYTDENDNPLPPPPELGLAFQVERWGAPAIYGNKPLPAQLTRRMSACLNIYQAVKSYQAGSYRLADWANSNPGAAKIITEIREMRMQNG